MRHSPLRLYRRATTAVQFALVAPLLFLIVLGIFELARALMVYTLLSNAARQGARLGIIEGKSTAQVTAVVDNVLTSQGISGNTDTVMVNDVVADASTAQANDEITVSVSVPYSKVTWVPVPNFFGGSISAQFTLRRE